MPQSERAYDIQRIGNLFLLELPKDFIAKNQRAQDLAASFKPVIFPALSTSLGPGLEADRLLCPVRALKYYLSRTDPILKGRRKLFVAFKKGYTKEISPITISSWLKKVIRLAYEILQPEDLQTLNITGHQVRAMAASWAALGGVSLNQIMESCHWRSHNTFTSFYLKDLCWADGQTFSLGPIVAAQNIVSTMSQFGSLN